ncbi:MAG: hypothetical protein M5U34_20140 [Chloroflexi bacterium]|nr:hypothetical protein [Chloroflexota bacterium]
MTDNGRGKLQQEKISSLVAPHEFVELVLSEYAGHARNWRGRRPLLVMRWWWRPAEMAPCMKWSTASWRRNGR